MLGILRNIFDIPEENYPEDDSGYNEEDVGVGGDTLNDSFRKGQGSQVVQEYGNRSTDNVTYLHPQRSNYTSTVVVLKPEVIDDAQ